MTGADMNEPRSVEQAAWHVSARMLEAYVGVDLDVARSASVEQHLLGCGQCRDALASISLADSASVEVLDALWLDVIDAVDRPRPSVSARLLWRLGVSDRVAAVVAATPALRWSWLASIVVALVFAVANAERSGGSDALLLVIAPLIPLVGIGTAYGAGVDPLHEVARAAPVAGSRIFLYRSLAVLLTSLPLVLVASFVLRLDGLVAVAWLLPALGLVGATLALSTWVPPRLAAAATGSGWLVLLGVLWTRSAGLVGHRFDSTSAFRPVGQLAFALLAVGGAAVFAARFEKFDRPDATRMEAR